MNDLKSIALQFNNCINTQDLEGLVNLMTDDHVFIDSVNNKVVGKQDNKLNWAKFFKLFPVYRNVFEIVTLQGSTVIMLGYSLCSDEVLNNVRSIWTAKVENNKLKEWRVYTDSLENRAKLGI